MKITKSLFKTMLLSTTLAVGQAHAAAAFSPEVQPLGYIGPLELDTTDLSSGAKAYRGWFENGAWQGDLIEYTVTSSGSMSSSISLAAVTPMQTPNGTNWSAHVQLAANAGGSSHWNTGRKIITSTNGTNQVAFRWANLLNAQKQMIDSVAYGAGDTSSDILDYLRGDRSNENPFGSLRLRYTVLGDIVHSNPEYVAAPEGDFSSSSYITFKNANASRAPRVYVGANDGMLHAFNANNGNEVWAYVPSMVMHKMSRLAGTPYAHTYFVDGGITIADAFYSGGWHSVLVGSMGAGARGMFALDVTSPAMTSENVAAGNDKKILWELSSVGNDDVGYIFDATTITQLNDGKWYAINGNGVSSVNGIAKLFLVELSSGAVTVLSTGAGSAGSPNGLAAPALVDTNSDGKADIAFAGDIDGDMWKFDLSGATSASWKMAYKLYNGLATQPITLAPDVTNHPQFGYLVLFGTGRLYTDADINDNSVQALYGIWDTGSAPTGAETRLQQLLSGDTDFFGGGFTENVRTFTTVVPIDYGTYKGWKVELPAGERLLTPPQLRAGRVKTTITDPGTYNNWLLEVTFDEGGVADDSIFDLDRNGKLNTADRVLGNGDVDFDDPEDIPMGWQRPTGNMSQVTIASLAAGIDTLFLNFLNPQLVPPVCTGICAGGLSGGHMDVDTDAGTDDGLGGGTNGHVHEYDDKTNRTFVDYFDIDPLGTGKLTNVTDVGIAGTEKFIVLMANADWSPGGELTLNNKVYNVVRYQRIIHKALANWNGTDPLLDPDGDSLIFTIDGIQAAGGTLKSTFNSTAIIAGGLIPTNTGCVNNSASITNGRWRNGSLIFHLVKASVFAGLAGGSALDRVVVQTPSDLKSVVVLSDGTQVELTEDLNGDLLIDGTSPAYEIYGGLVARGNAEFLFESTLFWHWSPRECYGDPGWEAEYILATQGVPVEVFQEMLEDAGFADFEELVAFVETLEDCKDIKEKKGGCQKTYRQVEDLYNMGLLVEANNRPGGGSGGGGGGGGSNGGGGGSISGEPLILPGGVSESGITAGPNFETGRRTWIDILPE